MKLPSFHRCLPTCALSLFVALAGASAWAQTPEERAKELEAALESTRQANQELERKVKTLSGANAVLGESLTEANKKLQALEGDYKEAVLQLEILGIESFNTEGKGMEERLKKAVSDLRLVEDEKAKIAEAAMNLSTTVLAYLKDAVNANADARKEVEKSLRECDKALGLLMSDTVVAEKTLADASVISLKQELNLVVLDAGQRQGLATGTPIRIQRKDRIIATALVVDVREQIAGAVIRELTDPKDTVKLGDQIRLITSGS